MQDFEKAPPDVKEHDRKLFRSMVFDKPISNIYSDDWRLRLKEKADNLRTYFGSKEEFEKAKGGRTHYKVKLSFDVPATNQQIRELTNYFL